MWYVIGYLVIAVLWYGIDYAVWQRSFPTVADKGRAMDRVCAALSAIGWPVAALIMVVFVMFSGRLKFHGIKFK